MTVPTVSPPTDAQREAEKAAAELALARAREPVTVRHTPKDRALRDVKPYTFTCTRKAWEAGIYPAAEGFELVGDLSPEERRALAIEEAKALLAEEEAAEAAAKAAAATR